MVKSRFWNKSLKVHALTSSGGMTATESPLLHWSHAEQAGQDRILEVPSGAKGGASATPPSQLAEKSTKINGLFFAHQIYLLLLLACQARHLCSSQELILLWTKTRNLASFLHSMYGIVTYPTLGS